MPALESSPPAASAAVQQHVGLVELEASREEGEPSPHLDRPAGARRRRTFRREPANEALRGFAESPEGLDDAWGDYYTNAGYANTISILFIIILL